MNDVLLITVDDLKEVTSIPNSMQTELLEPYLLIAQGYYCDNLLGDALVGELKNQITGNSLTSLNQTLLLQYIRPVIAYGTWFEFMGLNTTKTTQVGEVKDPDTPDQESIVFKRQNIKDKITFFQEQMKKYLEKNLISYPLYRSTCSVNNSYSNGIYLGRVNF